MIDRSRRIVITTHMSPDGDAVGSSLGLAKVLEVLGKEVKIITPDEPPRNLMFLPGAKEIVVYCRYVKFATELIEQSDLIFCLDYNGLSRIDRVAPALEAAKAAKVMIDHHLNPEDFAAITISYPEMSSTCVLLFRVLCQLELFNAIDKDSAGCIMAGMMTDTGNFTYNSNDPDIYAILAELLRKGADKDAIYKRLFNTYSDSCIRLNGYALSRKMEVWKDYGAALITLSRDELNRFHYSRGDTEGLVNRPLAIPGIVYSAFFREEDGYVKVSMRSTGDFPVDRICCGHFGGGGHRNAAGGEFHGTMEEAVNIFKSLLKQNKQCYIKDHLT